MAQYGAGVLSALDVQNQLAETAGTGVSLQVTSYLSGLSDASQFLLKVKLSPYPVRCVPLLFLCGHTFQSLTWPQLNCVRQV